MNVSESSAQLERFLSYYEKDPQNLSLLLDISRSYLEQTDLQNAQLYLNKAKKINSSACLGLQGFLYLKQEELEKAKDSLQQALTYEESSELRYYLGFIFFLEQDLDAARTMFSQVYDSEYKEIACVLIARIIHQEGKVEDAITFLKEHLQEHPKNAEALGLLALIYFDTNEEQLASKLSKKALKLDPNLYEAKIVEMMIRIAERTVNSNEIKQLLELYPNDNRLLFAAGSVCVMEGSFEEAILYFQNTLEAQPDFYDGHLALAWCYLLTDSLHDANETYQNAIELSDYYADAWAGLAIIQALNQDWEHTKILLEKARFIDPECFLVKIAEVLVYTHQDPKKAQNELFKVIHDNNLSVSQKLASVINNLELH